MRQYILELICCMAGAQPGRPHVSRRAHPGLPAHLHDPTRPLRYVPRHGACIAAYLNLVYASGGTKHMEKTLVSFVP